MIVILLNLVFFFNQTGGYDKEQKAARAYDLAALKYWGTTTTTNFPVSLTPDFDYALKLYIISTLLI